MPVLLYGLEACPLNKADINSLDFVINRLCMNIFKTTDINIVKYYQCQFNFRLPSDILAQRSEKFSVKYRLCDSIFCQLLQILV